MSRRFFLDPLSNILRYCPNTFGVRLHRKPLVTSKQVSQLSAAVGATLTPETLFELSNHIRGREFAVLLLRRQAVQGCKHFEVIPLPSGVDYTNFCLHLSRRVNHITISLSRFRCLYYFYGECSKTRISGEEIAKGQRWYDATYLPIKKNVH
jgi:hypothetical protein